MSEHMPPAWWSRLTANVAMTRRWGPSWRLLNRCRVRGAVSARCYGGYYLYHWQGTLPWLSL